MTVEQPHFPEMYLEYLCPVCPDAEKNYLKYVCDCVAAHVAIPASHIAITSFDIQQTCFGTSIQKGAANPRPQILYGPLTFLIIDGPCTGILAANLTRNAQCETLMEKGWNMNRTVINHAREAGFQAMLLRPIVNRWPEEIMNEELQKQLYDTLEITHHRNLIKLVEDLDPFWYTKLLTCMLIQSGLPVNRKQFLKNSLP
jgi:hypothetical protein